MAKKIVETKEGRFVVIPLTKPYLIEGKVYNKGCKLLVEEDGVVDTIQTNADIADASSGDFDELYDRANMRRMRHAMDADDLVPESPVALTMEDVLTPEERVEMRRRLSRMEADKEDKSEMFRRMRSRMDKDEDKEDKDKMDKDEEDKDKMDKDEEDKKDMRARMLARMKARMKNRMDKDEEDKDKMDKDEEKDKMDKDEEDK
jgi:hypothetical protein